jgi:hypothetical protein
MGHVATGCQRQQADGELKTEVTGMTDDFAAGASASLKKTTKAILRFLRNEGKQPRNGLRDHLHNRLGDLAVKWYRYGFNRGHKESDKHCKNGKVPRTLRYDATREFFIDAERTVHLKSTLKERRSKL